MRDRQLQEYIVGCREQACRWARQVLDDPDAVILDTETTGLGPDAEVVEIALLDCRGGTLLDTLVRPTSPIPPDAAALHGITDAAVANAPGWPEIHERVDGLLKRASRTVIYNADYDAQILQQTCSRHGLPPPGPPRHGYECAMKKYARFVGDWSESKRDFLWKPLKGGGHRAREDCLATLRILREMAAGGRPR